jgi:hypothetical protein
MSTDEARRDGSGIGLKFDDGKLQWDLLPIEASDTTGDAPDGPLDEALNLLESWFHRQDDAKLQAAFNALSVAYSHEFGEVSGYDYLEAIVEVLTYGAQKYSPRNWENGIAYSRCYAATWRHVVAHLRDERYDEETGLPHIAHAMCEVAFLLTFEAQREKYAEKFDDRPRKPAQAAVWSSAVWSSATVRVNGEVVATTTMPPMPPMPRAITGWYIVDTEETDPELKYGEQPHGRVYWVGAPQGLFATREAAWVALEEWNSGRNNPAPLTGAQTRFTVLPHYAV